MYVEIGDKRLVIRHNISWYSRYRIYAACAIVAGAALLWIVPTITSAVEKFWVGVGGGLALALGVLGAFRPLVTEVRVEGQDGLLIVHWRGLIRQSVEHTQASAVNSIEIDEDEAEELKTYSMHVRLKTGKRLLLADGLHDKPAQLARQIETTLGLSASTNPDPKQ
jgi:hypothetical protein